MSEPLVFKPVGEPIYRVEFDANYSLRHLQRINDFLEGMGVKPESGAFEFVWTLRMTQAQRDRWNAWLEKLPDWGWEKREREAFMEKAAKMGFGKGSGQ